jgi:hypothetical protein
MSGDAWSKIEAAAAGLVAKSSEPLTQEAAVARLLKSERGQELYFEYQLEQAMQPGYDVTWGSSRQSVRKATSAMDTIESKAEELMARSPGMSREKAIETACRQNPDLYEAYRTAIVGTDGGGADSGKKTAAAIESPDAARGRVRKGELSAIRKQVGDVVQLWIDTPGAGPLADWLGMSDAERVQKANGAPNGVPVEKAGDDDVDRWLDELFGP